MFRKSGTGSSKLLRAPVRLQYGSEKDGDGGPSLEINGMNVSASVINVKLPASHGAGTFKI